MRRGTYTCVLKTQQGQTLPLGGNAPIRIQAMTSTDTADDVATAIQIKELVQAGAEIVRVTVNNLDAAKSISRICHTLERMSIDVPIVGDFHYNGHVLLTEVPDCARLLAKYRINPGNVGMGQKHITRFKQIIELALKYEKPVRIGVNWGSLDEEKLSVLMDENQLLGSPLSSQKIMMQTMIASALDSATLAIDCGMRPENIILSCKVSVVQDLIKLYQQLSEKCKFPLHLGLTEAGMGIRGIVASTSALVVLLQEGIGDTIRISLTPQPGEARSNEVLVAKEILQSLEIRRFHPTVVACPGCGRTSSNRFQELAQSIDGFLKNQMTIWKKKYIGVENLKIAVMGCIVNGPGESKQADIGISLPGSGEDPIAPVYIKGQKYCTLKGENIAHEFQEIVENFVHKQFSQKIHDDV